MLKLEINGIGKKPGGERGERGDDEVGRTCRANPKKRGANLGTMPTQREKGRAGKKTDVIIFIIIIIIIIIIIKLVVLD